MACHTKFHRLPQCIPSTKCCFPHSMHAQILLSLGCLPLGSTRLTCFLFFGLPSGSLRFLSCSLRVSSFCCITFSHHFLFNSCSANLRVCGPIPMQPGHPVVRPYLSRTFWRNYNLFTRLPLQLINFPGYCVSLI